MGKTPATKQEPSNQPKRTVVVAVTNGSTPTTLVATTADALEKLLRVGETDGGDSKAQRAFSYWASQEITKNHAGKCCSALLYLLRAHEECSGETKTAEQLLFDNARNYKKRDCALQQQCCKANGVIFQKFAVHLKTFADRCDYVSEKSNAVTDLTQKTFADRVRPLSSLAVDLCQAGTITRNFADLHNWLRNRPMHTKDEMDNIVNDNKLDSIVRFAPKEAWGNCIKWMTESKVGRRAVERKYGHRVKLPPVFARYAIENGLQIEPPEKKLKQSPVVQAIAPRISVERTEVKESRTSATGKASHSNGINSFTTANSDSTTERKVPSKIAARIVYHNEGYETSVMTDGAIPSEPFALAPDAALSGALLRSSNNPSITSGDSSDSEDEILGNDDADDIIEEIRLQEEEKNRRKDDDDSYETDGEEDWIDDTSIEGPETVRNYRATQYIAGLKQKCLMGIRSQEDIEEYFDRRTPEQLERWYAVDSKPAPRVFAETVDGLDDDDISLHSTSLKEVMENGEKDMWEATTISSAELQKKSADFWAKLAKVKRELGEEDKKPSAK